MKNILILVASACIATSGCTTPSQKLAAVSLNRGVSHMVDIQYDLATIAKQQTLDLGVIGIENAFAKEDKNQAVAVLEKTFNNLNKIGWLQVQSEKAKAYISLSSMYISSQQGVLDLLIADFKKASAAADADTEAAGKAKSEIKG